MKKYVLLIILSFLFLGCSDHENANKNPNLPNYNFSVDINLSLPMYADLKYVSNSIYYPGVGVKGIIVFNTNGNGGYVAYDAACPNQQASSCAAMTVKGVNAICSCDKKEYNLFTGQSDAGYPLRPYRVQVVNENLIRIYN
jgi:nitrite reductase/ring-hydroxylating ferredoxin subunit